jgi:hypothetical protein
MDQRFAAMDQRFAAMDHRIDDIIKANDKRFDDLKDYIKSEFNRICDRFDRLESPIARK